MDLKNFTKHPAMPLALSLVLLAPPGSALGHGVGSETFPPVELNGRQVALEASSSQGDPAAGQQISISLLDFDSKITLRDVAFHIRSERGTQFLFEEEFKADNGVLVFNFVSEDAGPVVVEEAGGDLFGSLLGLESREIHVKGPKLADGGLYKFDVSVLAADGYSKTLDEPLVYNVGISVPQTVEHEIHHPDYGSQTIQTITYYDELSDFNYDIPSKEVSFSMPFDWTESNIEQTSVVHEELVIPKTFGDLLASGFVMYINGVRLSDGIVSIDDFADVRTVHFIVNQQELGRVFENSDRPGMDFVVKPASDKTQLSSVTQNGQFRVLVSWEPGRLESNSGAAISFDIMDVFLKDLPVAVSYDFSVTHGEETIFSQSGIAAGSKDSRNTAEFTIPDGVSGIIRLNFDNLSGNPFAATSVPVIVDSTVPRAAPVPSWIKASAGWWAEGSIGDDTFLRGIGFLISNDVIRIPYSQGPSPSPGEIPSWIKASAGWWAEGSIGDGEFVRGIQFLIEQGILVV